MFTYWNFLKCFNFTPRSIIEKMSVTDHRSLFNLVKTAFHEKNQENSRGLGWAKLVQGFRLSPWHKFLWAFSLLMVAFGESSKNMWRFNCSGEMFCAVQLVLLYPCQDYAKLISAKNCVLIPLTGPFEEEKLQLIFN